MSARPLRVTSVPCVDAMGRIARLGRCSLMLSLLWGLPAAAEPEALPQPLSLDEALRLAAQDTPLLEQARAVQDSAQAQLGAATADDGLQAGVAGRLTLVAPSRLAPFNDHNDSTAHLWVRKRLYDFGQTAAGERAAALGGDSADLKYLDARQRQHLAVMRAFFDVVLADLEYARDNEAMAIAYIRADRGRDSRELGRLSDVDMLELEAQNQEARRKRAMSEARQRVTRSALAIGMGRPTELASDLVPPEPPKRLQTLPEYEALLDEVMVSNPGLAALRAEVEAAHAAVDAARTRGRPILSAELDAGVYRHETGSRHPVSGGLVLEMPLLDGGRSDAAVAAARARLRKAQADLAAAQLELRQGVLELWLDLSNLQIRLEEADALGDFRELYLDRSRALYELEVKSDLGDAMTQVSDVRLQRARAEFDLRMVHARLAALAGRLLSEERP